MGLTLGNRWRLRGDDPHRLFRLDWPRFGENQRDE
jgi:hypothetical protein